MENATINCPACNEILPTIDSLSFCPYCATQIKCKNCTEILLPKAKACIKCGSLTLLVNSNTTDQPMNEFDFEQKGDSRRVKSRFTNEAVTAFAEAFGIVIGTTTNIKRLSNPFNGTATKNSLNTQKLPKPNIDSEDAIVISDDEYNDLLQRHFKLDDNKLKLVNSRLKHTGKLDQAIRLAILTLFAYERINQQQIDKTLLIEMLSSAKLYDGNFRAWVAKCDEIVRDDNSVQLSVPGQEVAVDILREIADDSITKGAIIFSKIKTGRRSGKKKQAEGSDIGSESKQQINSSPRKKGAVYYFGVLIDEGYFKEKRKIADVIEYLKVNKAESYTHNDLSTPLKRMIKSQKLKREKNSDGQYEYFV